MFKGRFFERWSGDVFYPSVGSAQSSYWREINRSIFWCIESVLANHHCRAWRRFDSPTPQAQVRQK
jgi:hypothetical protein